MPFKDKNIDMFLHATLLQLWKDIENFQTRKLALRQIHNADFGNMTFPDESKQWNEIW